jgi:organic radical activating enzyme
MCQTWDGRYFRCDTDFSCHTYKTVSELVGETWERHVCLTGGEPLIHERRLVELGFFQQMFAKQIMIHYETSGTVQTIFDIDKRVWVAVAPKHGCLNSMLERADEVKYLVDENFDEKRTYVHFAHQTIFVSPINNEKEVSQENVQHALKILKTHPTWRLSAQWHKFLGLL